MPKWTGEPRGARVSDFEFEAKTVTVGQSSHIPYHVHSKVQKGNTPEDWDALETWAASEGERMPKDGVPWEIIIEIRCRNPPLQWLSFRYPLDRSDPENESFPTTVREFLRARLRHHAARAKMHANETTHGCRDMLPVFEAAFFAKPRGAVVPLAMQNANMPLAAFAVRDVERRLDFDPPYQRGHVWGPEQKEKLVLSILQNVPIGVVFLNRPPYGEGKDNRDRVVDGKQRLLTVLKFMHDEFDVPAEWFEGREVADPLAERVTWSGLTAEGKRRVDGYCVSTYITKLQTTEDEARLFDLVNFSGVPQGKAEGADVKAVEAERQVRKEGGA